MRTKFSKWLFFPAIAGLLGLAWVVPAAAVIADDDSVFISEIHYDNASTDAGEAIEVFGPAGTDLTGWSVVRYNGNGGASYGTDALSGTIPDAGEGFGVVVVTYPANGLQNGSPDGVALVDDGGGVRQFLSYEGTFAATDGPAAGATSTDIGVSETSTTVLGDSLQLGGGGSCYEDLTWNAAAASTFGSVTPIVPDPAADCSVDDPDPELPPVRFSELHYDNVGTDANEAVEIVGPAGTDLTDWSVVLYNGNGGGTYGTAALSGTIPDLGGGTGVAVIDYPTNGLQNGSPDGMALVDAGGAVVEFLSYEGAISATDGPAVGTTSTDIGAAEGSSTLADQSLQRDDAGAWAGPSCNSFGDLNEASPDEFCPAPARPVKIHEIQGAGDTSPLLGERVVVEGVVVGDEEGPAPALRGFFVQEEDSDADADAATSEGIFVFNFDNDDVDLGDLVRVEGTVDEFFGTTQLASFVEIEVLGAAPGAATPADVSFPVVDFADLEIYEGMAVRFPQTLVISEYFNYDRFGDVVVALPAPGEDRPYNPTALFDPDSTEATDRLDLNVRSRITIDDGNSSQNRADPIHPINRAPFSSDNSFRGGDQVTGLTGPLHYTFGNYVILPVPDTGFDEYVQTVAPDAPTNVGGDLTIATLNALNYFVSLDDGPDSCGPTQDQECRGADDATEFERQRVKLLNALEGLDADVVGLVELENTPGVEPLADIVAGLNDRLGAGTYDYIDAGVDNVVGPDVIKVGVIYRTASVAPTGDVAVLETDAFLDPNGYGDPKNRAAVASSFVENASGEVFSVVVNHLKSKGSSCAPGDDHPLAGSCNDTRTKAAQALADWLTTSPTGVADDDWLILGDLNSYDKEDPISALAAAGYTDLIGQFEGEFAYSYVFDGQFGYLDYAMSSASLTSQVTGATEWHINADEPDIVDYNTSFRPPEQIALFDPTTPFRSSDHDAALVGLSLHSFDTDVHAWPSRLWPANHKLRGVVVFATSGYHLVPSAIVDVTSSEADSGLGSKDRPGDIVEVNDYLVLLRAERFSDDGRTYTIDVMLSDDGQVVFDTVTVEVPRRRSGW